MSSELTMPLILTTMGGEMLYILQQRLHAQKISADKARTVLEDVICSMFDPSLLNELFRREKAYTSAGTRALFDRLAHVSIMRLNTTSMDKLYDLISMGCKLQLMRASHPSHLLQICLNHTDEARALLHSNRSSASSTTNAVPTVSAAAAAATPATPASALLTHAARRLAALALSAAPEALTLARRSTLRLLQDKHVKVSIFLQDALQSNQGLVYCTPSGEAPVGTEPPGTVRVFANPSNINSNATASSNASTIANKSAASVSGVVNGVQAPAVLLSGVGIAATSLFAPPVFPSVSASSFTVASHAHRATLSPTVAALLPIARDQARTLPAALTAAAAAAAAAATATSSSGSSSSSSSASDFVAHPGSFLAAPVPAAVVVSSSKPTPGFPAPVPSPAFNPIAATTSSSSSSSASTSASMAAAVFPAVNGARPSTYTPRPCAAPLSAATAAAAAAAAAGLVPGHDVVSILHPRRPCTLGRNLYQTDRKSAAAAAATAATPATATVNASASGAVSAASVVRGVVPAVAPSQPTVAYACAAAAAGAFAGVWGVRGCDNSGNVTGDGLRASAPLPSSSGGGSSGGAGGSHTITVGTTVSTWRSTPRRRRCRRCSAAAVPPPRPRPRVRAAFC